MDTIANAYCTNLFSEHICDLSGDIALKIDINGYITHASDNLSDIGLQLGRTFLLSHITDLVEPSFVDLVRNHVNEAFSGSASESWVEFPVPLARNEVSDNGFCSRRWYALKVQPIMNASEEVTGALCLIRSAQELRELGIALLTREITDPRTGLENRELFYANMKRRLALGRKQVVALVAIDSIKALRFRYGHDFVDDLIVAFSKFLVAMAAPGLELSILDDERFGVLMPDWSLEDARMWSAQVVQTFKTLVADGSTKATRLSVSAGIAQVQSTVDQGLREAELGLIFARTSGGGQVALAGYRNAA